MAAPNPFQKLKHGVLLCKANFVTFVETFNYLVDFAKNLSGDGDGNGQGAITIDRTIADRPIIRSRVNPQAISTTTTTSGRFNIITMDSSSSSVSLTLASRYYRVGGRTYRVDSDPTGITLPCLLALKVNLSGSTPSASYETYESFSAMTSAEADTDYFIMPLYEFDEDGKIVCDWRIGPDAAAGEF